MWGHVRLYVGPAALGGPPSTARPGFPCAGLRRRGRARARIEKRISKPSDEIKVRSFQPPSGERIQPTAQAVGGEREMSKPRRGGRPATTGRIDFHRANKSRCRWNLNPPSCARREPSAAVPHTVRIQSPCGARQVRDFHNRLGECLLDAHIDFCQCRERNSPSDAGSARSELRVCTKSGHPPVDALHSIEKTCTYKRVFFID